jgi:K+-transporting ATPase A subunit
VHYCAWIPNATTIEGASQQIPLGPIASQVAIKQLGTNGDGSALGLTASSFEGKEVRLGQFNSMLFATVTTYVSCGAVNMMQDSLSPLGGLVPLINMMQGEVISAAAARGHTECSCSFCSPYTAG